MSTSLLIPAQKVTRTSRELSPGSFFALASQLEEGERLVGVYLRGDFLMAPHLHSHTEHRGFENHVQVGLMECVGYYAVSEDIFFELVVT